MSVLVSDFTGCSVLLYDTKNNHLGSAIIKEHDRGEQYIRLNKLPTVLNANDNCKVFVLSSPIPCEFSGKLRKIGGSLIIAMFQGNEVENRSAMRHPIKTTASISALIIDDQVHFPQNPINVKLINISTNGVRFRAPFYTLNNGDIFKMHLVISNSKRVITAEVVNSVDQGTTHTDYGCRFMEIS